MVFLSSKNIALTSLSMCFLGSSYASEAALFKNADLNLTIANNTHDTLVITERQNYLFNQGIGHKTVAPGEIINLHVESSCIPNQASNNVFAVYLKRNPSEYKTYVIENNVRKNFNCVDRWFGPLGIRERMEVAFPSFYKTPYLRLDAFSDINSAHLNIVKQGPVSIENIQEIYYKPRVELQDPFYNEFVNTAPLKTPVGEQIMLVGVGQDPSKKVKQENGNLILDSQSGQLMFVEGAQKTVYFKTLTTFKDGSQETQTRKVSPGQRVYLAHSDMINEIDIRVLHDGQYSSFRLFPNIGYMSYNVNFLNKDQKDIIERLKVTQTNEPNAVTEISMQGIKVQGFINSAQEELEIYPIVESK